jgi:hypothetical protein
MPLTKEELIKLKHQINQNDYLVVESGTQRILIVRSAREYPDIVNDLDVMINKLDNRDTKDLSHAMIIGEEEVIGIPLMAIESLVERRREDDEKIAEDLGEKLIEPYTTLLFESDNDPLKTLRLGIRVSGNLEDFKPQELPEILFSKIKSLPRHSEVVYLIAEDGYIRLSGNEFYKRLREFLKENPSINKELAKEFIHMTRGRLADHFVESEPYSDLLIPGKQESINGFIAEPDEPDETEPSSVSDSEEEPDEELDEEPEEPDVNADDEVQAEEDHDEPIVDTQDVKVPESKLAEPLKCEPLRKLVQPEPLESNLPAWMSAPMARSEPESSKKEYLSSAKLIMRLQDKLPLVGFEVMHGIEIPGVDLAAKNPESFITRVFFCYMPKFELKKAIALERSIEKFSPELTIIITAPGIEDSETKLFAVGKDIVLSDIDTIFNTNFLVRLEEKI